jgi:hypothetical protein
VGHFQGLEEKKEKLFLKNKYEALTAGWLLRERDTSRYSLLLVTFCWKKKKKGVENGIRLCGREAG